MFLAFILTYSTVSSDTLFSLINKKPNSETIKDWFTSRYITPEKRL